MVTLVVENGTGLSTANTYISNADADTYFGSHLYATAWTGATEANQDIALAMSTRLIDDNFRFDGKKSSDTQALSFPRYGVSEDGYELLATTIPQSLKDATAEFAKWLIAEDRTAEDDTVGFKSLKAGSLSMEIDPGDRSATIPDVVRDMIAEYSKPTSGGLVTVTR